MLTNRPEFHFVDTAAMHLGRDPVLDLQHLDRGADRVPGGRRRHTVLVTEQAFLDTASRVRGAAKPRARGRRRRRPREARSTLAELEARATRSFDFEAAWRAVQPDDVLHGDLHLRHHRPAQGRAADPRQHPRRPVRAFDEMFRLPGDGRVVSWLPMAHIAERDASHYVPMRLRRHHHLLPRPAPGRRLPARSAPDLVLRGAAGLGKTQGGDRDRHRARARRRPEAGDRVGAEGRPAQGRGRAGGRGGPGRARRRARQGRRARCCRKIRERVGLDQVALGARRRRAHARAR